jgi:tRNA(Ile)-lysidine synthase
VVGVPDGPLEVRTRRPGDRVRAAGRDVSLKRFLMDRRVPAQERGALPLLAAGHQVLWVPGQRIDGAHPGERRFVRLELQPTTELVAAEQPTTEWVAAEHSGPDGRPA